jgi:hypothetical protein
MAIVPEHLKEPSPASVHAARGNPVQHPHLILPARDLPGPESMELQSHHAGLPARSSKTGDGCHAEQVALLVRQQVLDVPVSQPSRYFRCCVERSLILQSLQLHHAESDARAQRSELVLVLTAVATHAVAQLADNAPLTEHLHQAPASVAE